MSLKIDNPLIDQAAEGLSGIGQAISDDQKLYLDGFITGLQSKGVSFGDLAETPGTLSGRGSCGTVLEDIDIDSLCKEEKLKLEENPLESFKRIIENARENKFPEGGDVFKFKWNGLFYLTPVAEGFMSRLRIPGGLLKSYQMRGIAEAAQNLTSGYVQITTRNNIQCRLIQPKDAPAFLDSIQEVGLHTRGAGADNVRNITANPTAGIDPYELIDVTPYYKELAQRIINTLEFYDLPRKFNIAFDGGGLIGALEDTNDIGFTAVKVSENDAGLDPGIYFRVALGGVTGHKTFATDLGVLVKPEEIVDISCVLLRLFIKNGNRTNRKKARFKYVVDSWGMEKMRQEIATEYGSELFIDELDSSGESHVSKWNELPSVPHSHVGAYPQKQDGLYYLGVGMQAGQITTEQMFQIADWAEAYGNGEIRLTVWQNLIIPNIPQDKLPELQKKVEQSGLYWKQSHVRSGVVACTGNSYCKFAATQTKGHAVELMDYLEEAVQLDQPVNIHLTGCPHSCAQHYIGDIGLLGATAKVDGQKVEGYHVVLGGGFGRNRKLGREYAKAVPVNDLKKMIRGILQGFMKNRQDDEAFQTFCNRHEIDDLKALFDGESVTAEVAKV
ncbi:MAG: NirA family protein [Verrucomicrobiota bacterium]